MPAPYFDYTALAPEIILTVAIVAVLVADLLFEEREKYQTSTIAGVGCLAALVPILYLAGNGADRTMFGGAYLVDNYALLMKALFLLAGYVTILLSTNYIEEGDYYQGEYYVLLLTAILGMTIMASARDLVTIFVALETLSIPTYLLAGWRKHDARSNESSLKYYLMGVLSSAVMLYGMSIVYGLAGDTRLVEIAKYVSSGQGGQLFDVAIFFTLVGFAFKVSAVPFHFWAPDSYEGAPTPVTAFLSVASKTGGFVALLSLVYVGFFGRGDAWQPILWVLAAASMTVGNLIALRQTNLVRMLAYSSIAQGGFMLVPFAVANQGDGSARPEAFSATLRRARPHPRRRGRRPRAARGGARGRPRAAPRQGDGARPRRPRHVVGRLVLHEPVRRRRRAPRRRAGVRAARRHGEDVGGMAHRAGGVPPRLRRSRGHRDLLEAHARAHEPRRGHHGGARRARPRDRRRGPWALRRGARAGARLRGGCVGWLTVLA